MKKVLATILSLILVFTIIPATALNASAATFEDINQSSVFVKQQTNYTCTLASAVMVVRRASMMAGKSNWASVTESSMRGTAWVENSGLKWSFTYNGISVGHANLSGGSSNNASLISLLASHPEGIVAYNGGKSNQYHAVILTDYTNGTFYCADPAGSTNGRVPLTSSTIVGSGQDGKVANFTAYWYVTSPKVTLTNTETPEIPKISSIVCNKENYAKITWNSAKNASKYYVHLCNSDWTKSYFYDTTNTSYELNNLGLGTYHVRIISSNISGVECDNVNNSFITFKIVERPLVPQIDSIVVNGDNVTINWSAAERASVYVVHFCNSDYSKAYFYRTDKLNYKFSDLSVGTYHVRIIAETENGLESLAKNNVFKDFKIVPICVHNIITKNAKAATYFAKGYTGDKVCTVCGEVIEKGKTIAQLKLKTPKITLNSGKKSFKVKYTKVKDATGFQVRYRIKGKWTVKTFNSKKTVTKTIKKLKKGKKYTVQIRAFIKQYGMKAYSSWTKTKKVIVK